MGSGGSKNMVGDSGVQVMPLYYVKDAFATADDIWRARASWKLITEDASPEYLKLKNDPENPLAAESCMAWFFTSFYDHLFEIHPSSRQQFKNDIGVQGRAFANMIDTSLRLIDDPEHLVKTLNEVAKSHTKKGVSSFQYGIVGESLIWTLEKCLGPAFDAETKLAWTKIYSFLLNIIIPVALTEEKRLAAAKTPSSKDLASN